LKYTGMVHQGILAWLQDLGESDLDRIPNCIQHLFSYPVYL